VARRMSRKEFIRVVGGTVAAAAGIKAEGALPQEASKRPRASIRVHNGAPTLFIDGRPHSAFSYMTYGPEQRYFKDFADAGVNLFSYPANADSLELWGMAEVWKGPEEFDYRVEDERLEMIVSACPRAYIFPRVHTIAPRWWIRANPDEVASQVQPDGTRKPLDWNGLQFPSWASKAGEEICKEALRRYIDHVRSGPFAEHLIGYHVCSWVVGEWMALGIDSSRPMTEAFREWLDRKYRTADALRAAWGNADVTFETAECPCDTDLKLPASQSFYTLPKDQPAVDYWENYAEVVSGALLALAQTAKEACCYESLVGVFFGYLLEFGATANFHGHTALGTVLRSPHVDFLSSPTCYRQRSLTNGYSYFMSLPETVKLHGKMWWDENDYRTYLTMPKGRISGEERAKWSPDECRRHYEQPMLKHFRVVGLTPTLEDSISHQRRQVAHCLSRAAGMWWFDMGGGWFDDREFMKAIGNMASTAQRSLEIDRTDTAEIAVVLDARSLKYCNVGAAAWLAGIVDQAFLLGRIGAPVSFYLLEDLEMIPDRHRLWVFLHAVSLDENTREMIDRKAKRDGKVCVWMYAPDLLHEGRIDLERASGLTGIRLACLEEEAPFGVVITEAAHPLTAGLFGTVYALPAAVGIRVRDQLWTGQDASKGWDAKAQYKMTLCRPQVYADDPDAAVLGYCVGGTQPGLVAKALDGWTSVYSSAGPLPPALLRNLARLAGVHLYLDTDDIVYANQSFLAVSTNAGGVRRIRLPRVTDVVDAFSGNVLARQADAYEVELPQASTSLFFLGKPEDWARTG